METPAIELRNITKTFGSIVANKDVSMTVNRGEILSILGENGSGKTTLMNMISGIYFPDAGEILIDGKEAVIKSPKDAFSYGIGMIHQHCRLPWCDGRCVQGPGTYSPRRADPRLLATPTSRGRVAAPGPNWGRL